MRQKASVKNLDKLLDYEDVETLGDDEDEDDVGAILGGSKGNGWADKKQHTLINFLVNSPKGNFFIEFVDAPEHLKTGDEIYELLNRFVKHVREANMVQVVTDNASNCELIGKLLEIKRPHLYWTPRAAHCIDLMLEDIGKIPNIHNTIKMAVTLNGYIYIRSGVVNMLRRFTSEKELIRPAVT
ncbi:uncharacterized protein LOC131170224 [Hevea brasiliensis]|uniref:uncharacterized protein LOC131170224 n=1 Tax=Hevea brasiliensis TaxID=3981 RepID=UPI0025DBD1F0|nr:uncharacterized protein LOC131170224 [Hevea brasiliensis]